MAMRTDKEQFEKIEQAYETHEVGVKRKRKLITIVLSAALVVVMIVSSVLVIPGLIKKDPTVVVNSDVKVPVDDSKEYFITDKGKTDKVERNGFGGDLELPEGAYEPAADIAPISAEGMPVPGGISDRISGIVVRDGEGLPGGLVVKPGGAEDQTQYVAGTLTGAELRDRLYYTDFNKSTQELYNNDEYIRAFDLIASTRCKVTVKNGETPLSFVKVELLDNNGKVLYTAITDNKGEAYVFCRLTAQSTDAPAKIVCSLGEEKTEISLEQYDTLLPAEVNVALKGENKGKKLDLMFVIDTTGSMGDELEYLKTEVRDIIAKISGDENYSVRTSVNFYRDEEGDAYILHATPFRTDPEEVYAFISKEYSAGGGDYPEAVHLALDNAVNDHAWDEDAVKLCFIVLDAPPHNNEVVYNSLRATILAAAAKGIRIVPIVSSGSDGLTEYLMRTFAVMTGGTYTFLTDDSGVGYAHSKPETDVQYTIEKLNEMIVRIAKEYLA